MINRWLIRQHLKFTSKTFPKGTALGALIHAGREVQEAIDDINNKEDIDTLAEEYADILGCLIDSINRSGISRRKINLIFRKKLEKNKKRKWKDNGDGSYSHIKEDINDSVPTLIQIMAVPLGILEVEDNEAKGEITKFKLVDSQKNAKAYGEQVVGSAGGYDRIYRHIYNDWFKEVGKWPEKSC